jgi:transcriptional regulator with XRE-family HTH domain
LYGKYITIRIGGKSMEEKLKQAFGEYLRKLRKERGFTLREVENKVNVSNAYLSQLERGERGVPTIRVLSKLAEAYGVSLTSLTEEMEGIIHKDREEYMLNLPSPDSQFVIRSYESLSEGNKEALMKFLQYLLKEEQK